MLFPGRRHTLIHDFCSRATLIKRDSRDFLSTHSIPNKQRLLFLWPTYPSAAPARMESWPCDGAGPVEARTISSGSMAISGTYSPRRSIRSTRVCAAICPIRRSGCRTVVSVRLANAAPGRKEVWPIVRHLRCLDDAILGVFRDGTCRRGVVQSRGNRAGSKAEVVSDGFEGDSRFRTRGLLLPQRLGRLRGPPRMNRRNIQSHVAHTMA